MFKKEFDIVLSANSNVVETMEKLRSIGINVEKAQLKWVYDVVTDDPVDSIIVYSGRGFMPSIIPKITKNGFEHLILEGRHTFM